MANKNFGSIGTAILFISMMLTVYWILVRNAFYRLGVVIQEIPEEYIRLFVESEILHIKNGIYLLLIFGLTGWGFYLWTKIKRN